MNSKVILLRGDATETGRVTDCSLSPFSRLKLHYIVYLFSSYACVSVCGNFVLLPVSVASPLNNITLRQIIRSHELNLNIVISTDVDENHIHTL